MSYTYLQASGEVSSAECYSDIPAYVLSRLNLIAEKSFYKGNETESCQSFQSGTMCEPLTASRGGGKLTSSVEDSLVKTYLVQGKAQGLKESEADCGLNLQESLAKYDPATHSWRTRQCSLFEGSGECLETFPKSGMMQGGVLWELTMWEHPTSERECGFWRTPDTSAGGIVSDRELEELANGNWKRPSGSQKQLRLQDQVREPRLYPTPNCSGMDGGSNSRKANKKRGIYQKLYSTPTRSDYKGRGTNSKQQGLPEIVKNLYPTPTCHDTKAKLCLRQNHQNGLGEVVHGGMQTPPTKTARLNPNWVEWLMGWPIGWTDLKPLGMDKFRLWRQQHLDY